jgi:hypothetical protein
MSITLLSFHFGKFGNYGTSLELIKEDEFSSLKMNNWAYGETNATLSTSVNPDQLIDLGRKLHDLGVALKEKKI